jgi:hypothetical protein
MADDTSTQGNGTGSGWRAGLAGELDDLGRWVEGRFVLEPDESAELVPAERFLDLDYLREAVTRAADGALEQWGHLLPEADALDVTDPAADGAGETDDGDEDVDLRLAVVRFTRHYTSSLTAIALVGLARGVGLDMSAAHCQLVIWRDLPFRTVLTLDDADVVTCDARPNPWLATGTGTRVATVAELRDHVWRGLYAGHIAPLFASVRQITRVTRGLMWTNAAEWVGMVSDGADEYLPPDQASLFVADREALLGAPVLPGLDGPNPLLDRLDWAPVDEPDFPHGVQTRRTCCGTYLLADRGGRLCQSCPFLPLDDRMALVRERHGVSMGQPGGPAEQRSIELGRSRMKLAT